MVDTRQDGTSRRPFHEKEIKWNGLALRLHLVRADLTLVDVVRATGYSERTVQRWSRDEYAPPAKILPTIAKLLGCAIADLQEPIHLIRESKLNR